jgi:signal transduction histidine kinase
MSNYLSILEDDLRSGRTDGAADLAARVREGLERAAGVTRQVLAFADPGKGQPVRLDLNNVLEEAVAFLRSNPAYRRAELTFVPAGGGVFVRGNPVTLGQLFLNLLINAHQFQPDGGRIEVVACTGGRSAVVSVSDEGPGIDPEVLSRIFEPFVSTRGSTGLGLSVCHAIALAHGGNITAENRNGGGACFRVVLPLDAAGLDTSAERRADPRKRGIDGSETQACANGRPNEPVL